METNKKLKKKKKNKHFSRPYIFHYRRTEILNKDNTPKYLLFHKESIFYHKRKNSFFIVHLTTHPT